MDTDNLEVHQSTVDWWKKPADNCLLVTQEGSQLLKIKNARNLSAGISGILQETAEDEHNRIALRESGPEDTVYYDCVDEERAIDDEELLILSQLGSEDNAGDTGYAEEQSIHEYDKFLFSQLGPEDEITQDDDDTVADKASV